MDKYRDRKAEAIKNDDFYHYKILKRQEYKGVNVDWSLIKDKKACELLYDSVRRQRRKIRNHIEYLVHNFPSSNLFFLTLTLSNDSLSYSDKSLKNKINLFTSQFDDYLLNVDYGDKSDRKHYHAFVCFSPDTCYLNSDGYLKTHLLDNYDLGLYDLQPFRGNDDYNKISSYITKLVSHSLKVKQSYVSVKKGSAYQKHLYLMRHEKYCRSNYI